ncbi:MAG: flagellar FlbD family protein [Thermoleophilia bacterium]|nr:flagellar FlbD family protein [Thermoleophilia bacterium]
MITLHKLNGGEFVLNAELIETLEATPDTTIALIDRRHIMVAESVDEVVDKVMRYRRATAGVPVSALALPANQH